MIIMRRRCIDEVKPINRRTGASQLFQRAERCKPVLAKTPRISFLITTRECRPLQRRATGQKINEAKQPEVLAADGNARNYRGCTISRGKKSTVFRGPLTDLKINQRNRLCRCLSSSFCIRIAVASIDRENSGARGGG